jgi:hypothetical protein
VKYLIKIKQPVSRKLGNGKMSYDGDLIYDLVLWTSDGNLAFNDIYLVQLNDRSKPRTQVERFTQRVIQFHLSEYLNDPLGSTKKCPGGLSTDDMGHLLAEIRGGLAQLRWDSR